MTTYEKATKEEIALVQKVMKDFHPGLADAKVKVEVLFAYSTTDDVRPLKQNKYPCSAMIKILPLVQRVRGSGDALMFIDREAWNGMGQGQRIALIDHELNHLALLRDKDGVLKTDDVNRPKLKMRAHDFEVGGFKSVSERHGEKAPEIMGCKAIVKQYRQLLFELDDIEVPQTDGEDAEAVA